MRNIPPEMDPALVAEIDQSLQQVEIDHAVHIPLAIESGSRAWGFPSPDSDYDCRFIYIRRHRDYLSLFPKRDVIEVGEVGELDVNGWDIAKALRLLLKGNAVLIEWLTSPITYRETAGFRAAMLGLCHEIADRDRIGNHYLHLAYSMRNRVLENPDDAPLKKVFYVLRPIIAMRWLRLHESASVAPMNFQSLCAESELPAEVKAEIVTLIAQKAQTRELGRGRVPIILRDLIMQEIDLGEKCFVDHRPVSAQHVAQADAFFRRMIDEHAPSFT